MEASLGWRPEKCTQRLRPSACPWLPFPRIQLPLLTEDKNSPHTTSPQKTEGESNTPPPVLLHEEFMSELALVTGATGNNTVRPPSTWVLADECQESWRLPLFAQPGVFQGPAEARQSQPRIHDTRLPQQRASHHLSVADTVSVPPASAVCSPS